MKRGSVLIYVLVVFSFVFFLVSEMFVQVKRRYAEYRNAEDRLFFLKEAVAISTELMKRVILFDKGPLNPPTIITGKPFFVKTPSGRVYRVIFEVEDGKIPLRISFGQEIERLIRLKLPNEDAEALRDAILDFIDRDNLRRLKGAEDEYYRKLGYSAKNSNLSSLQELLWIKGIDYEIYKVLRDSFTVYTSAVNVNFADKLTLKALGFNEGDIASIEARKKVKGFVDLIFLRQVLGSRWITMKKKVYAIPQPSMLRAYVEEENSGEEVILIMNTRGDVVDVIWW